MHRSADGTFSTRPVRALASALGLAAGLGASALGSGCAALTNPVADGVSVRHLPPELLEPEDEPLGEPLLVVPVVAVGDREERVGAGQAVHVDVPPGGEQPEQIAGELAVRVEEPGGGKGGQAGNEGERPPPSPHDRRRFANRLPAERPPAGDVPLTSGGERC